MEPEVTAQSSLEKRYMVSKSDDDKQVFKRSANWRINFINKFYINRKCAVFFKPFHEMKASSVMEMFGLMYVFNNSSFGMVRFLNLKLFMCV